MEELSGTGTQIHGIGGAVRKKRSQTFRCRPEFQSRSETQDDPLSSAPPSEDASKGSSDENNGDDSSSKRKEFNLNQCVIRVSSAAGGDSEKSRKKTQRDDGGFNDFYNTDPGRSGPSSKRSSEGVLAPANWKDASKALDGRGGRNGEIESAGLSGMPVDGLGLGNESRVKKGSPDDVHYSDKRAGLQGIHWKDFSKAGFVFKKEDQLSGKMAGKNAPGKQEDNVEPVRKSKRVPKKRVMDGEFDEDEDEGMRYLEKLKNSKMHMGLRDDVEGSSKTQRKLASVSDPSAAKPTKDVKNKSRKDREVEGKKQKKEFADTLMDNSKREMTLTSRQRAMQSKDSSASGASTIEFLNGLPHAPPRSECLPVTFEFSSCMGSNKMCPAAIKVSAAPRTLNVRKFAESRAGEVEGLYSILADRLGNNFRSQRNKRRRTTAHDNRLANKRFRKRQKKLLPTSANIVGDSVDSQKVSRRVRRRNEFKKNPQSGFTTSRDETKRLRTHVWHAKRFTMTKLWGFYLPLGLHGRGMGSRALLKWYKRGVVVHDASYNSAIQLEGPEESLISVLNRVLVPSPSVDFGGISQRILSGTEYGIAMLHHVRARDTSPISPVTYMWRPLEEKDLGAIDSTRIPDGKNECSDALDSSVYRQCWVWIHASAFVDGINAIRCACEKEMDENGVLINCSSLEGQLAKIDVLGSNASRLLQKLLYSIPRPQGRPFQLKKCSTTFADKNLHSIDYCMLENEGYSRDVISLIVRDPRLLKDTLQTPSTGSIDEVISNQAEIMAESCSAVVEPPNDGSDVGLAHHNLWDVDGRIRPPVDEVFLSMEKHRNRMNSFYLSSCDPEIPNCSDISQCSRSCSIIVMRNNSLQKCFLGWSIILPVSWVKAFWIPLVTNGARAIGLRERHWIACESCLPCFPLDYPDCRAYGSYLTSKAEASCLQRDSQPPAIRAPKIPILPPWNTIQSFKDMIEDGLVGKERNASDGGPPITDWFDLVSVRSDACVSNFGGFVPRIARELSNPGNICSINSFLFPFRGEKVSTSQRVVYNNDNIGSLDGISQSSYNQKLCFLRVILRAFKKGVFEEGAVVCAPKYTDISLWMRQEDGPTGLQMPHASVSSYFTEGSSGKWQLQLAEDPSAQDFHRSPIGFVTTGFVHGSKKPLAIGYCEADSLAHLRKDQWSNVSGKRSEDEVYVLVRNLRSSAYRLGLATIVLEKHEEDLEFL